jgi:hypothetical protein
VHLIGPGVDPLGDLLALESVIEGWAIHSEPERHVRKGNRKLLGRAAL